MKPALTISGAIRTALARLKFCCNHFISGSRRKFLSAASDSVTSFCCSDCASAGVARKPAATANTATLLIERMNLAIMRVPYVSAARLHRSKVRRGRILHDYAHGPGRLLQPLRQTEVPAPTQADSMKWNMKRNAARSSGVSCPSSSCRER